MKTLYFDCFSGISGDMTLGALIDAGLDFEQLKSELSKLDLHGYTLSAEKETRGYLTGTKFTVKIGRAGIFRGTIDMLRRMPDEKFELVDFKSSKFSPAEAMLNVDYQFSIYAYALWKGVFKMPDGKLKMLAIKPENIDICWYHLRDHLEYKRNGKNGVIGDEKGDPRRITSRTRDQLADMKRDLSAIASNIHRMSFPRNPSYSTCPLCSYSNHCVEDSNGLALNRNERKVVQELINQNKEAVNAEK